RAMCIDLVEYFVSTAGSSCHDWRGTAEMVIALPSEQVAPSQECEATGKKYATCWRLTSPITPATLRGVGRSPGHTSPQMGSVWCSRRIHSNNTSETHQSKGDLEWKTKPTKRHQPSLLLVPSASTCPKKRSPTCAGASRPPASPTRSSSPI